jgi:hypothetical protein
VPTGAAPKPEKTGACRGERFLQIFYVKYARFRAQIRFFPSAAPSGLRGLGKGISCRLKLEQLTGGFYET